MEAYTDLTQANVFAVNKRFSQSFAQDATRPAYHFTPPAMWMNDVNGAIEAGGRRHLFYLHDPFQADGLSEAVMPSGKRIPGSHKPNRVWGHAVTKDWINWEHLPPALVPDRLNGEIKPISGGSIIAAEGNPLIMYTCVHEDAGKRGQNIAVGDGNLETFKTIAENPVITRFMPGAPEMDEEFRDPFLFYQDEQLYCIAAGLIKRDGKNKSVVALYEASDNDFRRWVYKGILIERDEEETRYFECPKLFRLNEYWVLVYSPYGPPRYMTGSLKASECSFIIKQEGFVDYTSRAYATVNLNGSDGNVYLMSWIPGWHSELHPSNNWGGCLSIPRRISVDDDGKMSQVPAPEVLMCIGEEMDINKKLETNSFFLSVESINEDEKIDIKASGKTVWSLQNKSGKLILDNDLCVSDEPSRFDLFWDVCVGELFVDDGRFCATTMVPESTIDLFVEITGNPAAKIFKMNPGDAREE